MCSGAKSIKSYGVEDGTKLYLAVKVPSPTPQTVTAPQPSTAHSSRFDSLLTQFLLKHFSAQDAEKVTRKFREVSKCNAEYNYLCGCICGLLGVCVGPCIYWDWHICVITACLLTIVRSGCFGLHPLPMLRSVLGIEHYVSSG